MTTLLHIIASPRRRDSKSLALAHAYIEKKQSQTPPVVVDTVDLFVDEIPDFDGDKAAAKMTFFGVGEMDNTRKTAWSRVEEVAQRFIKADEYVISVPMWNGGIPYKLKQYIDVITQPGLLFGFDPERGYFGLLENKKATVLLTSGVYAPGVEDKYGVDFHSTYLGWWLDMIGVMDVEMVRFQPSLLTEDPEGDFKQSLAQANYIANHSRVLGEQ